MHRVLVTVAALASLVSLAVSGLGSVGSAFAQAADPLSVMHAAFAGINSGNVDAVMATYADNATLTNYAGAFTGTGQIRRAVETDAALHPHLTIGNCTVAGDTVTCDVKRSDDRLRGLGIDFVNATTKAVVRDGKIQSLAATNTPESMARVQAAQAAAQRATTSPQTLPKTGASSLFYIAALAAAVLVLGLGRAFQRRRALAQQ